MADNPEKFYPKVTMPKTKYPATNPNAAATAAAALHTTATNNFD